MYQRFNQVFNLWEDVDWFESELRTVQEVLHRSITNDKGKAWAEFLEMNLEEAEPEGESPPAQKSVRERYQWKPEGVDSQ